MVNSGLNDLILNFNQISANLSRIQSYLNLCVLKFQSASTDPKPNFNQIPTLFEILIKLQQLCPKFWPVWSPNRSTWNFNDYNPSVSRD